MENLDDIRALIDDCLNAPGYQAAREAARQETWACIGEAAPRVVDYLMGKQRQLQADAAVPAEERTAKKWGSVSAAEP